MLKKLVSIGLAATFVVGTLIIAPAVNAAPTVSNSNASISIQAVPASKTIHSFPRYYTSRSLAESPSNYTTSYNDGQYYGTLLADSRVATYNSVSGAYMMYYSGTVYYYGN